MLDVSKPCWRIYNCNLHIQFIAYAIYYYSLAWTYLDITIHTFIQLISLSSHETPVLEDPVSSSNTCKHGKWHSDLFYHVARSANHRRQSVVI